MQYFVLLSIFLSADPTIVTWVDEPQYQACGPCCLYMACKVKEHEIDFESLVNSFDVGPQGETSLGELGDVARSIGLFPVAAKVEREWAEILPCPFIAHVVLPASDVDHFVLVLDVTPSGVVYIDPPQIATLESLDDFSQRWSGYVLAFADSTEDAKSLEWQISWRSQIPIVQALLITTLVSMILVVSKVRRTTSKRSDVSV